MRRYLTYYEDLRGNVLAVEGTALGEILEVRLVKAGWPLDGEPDTEAGAIAELSKREREWIVDRLCGAASEDPGSAVARQAHAPAR